MVEVGKERPSLGDEVQRHAIPHGGHGEDDRQEGPRDLISNQDEVYPTKMRHTTPKPAYAVTMEGIQRADICQHSAARLAAWTSAYNAHDFLAGRYHAAQAVWLKVRGTHCREAHL